MNEFDLEAEMYAEQARAEKTERARERVAAFNTLPPAIQHRRLTAEPDPDQHRAAVRTLRLHDNPPALRVWLDTLEDQCLTLIESAD